MKSSYKSLLIGAITSVFISMFVLYFLSPENNVNGVAKQGPNIDKPLYWVAPMDANFKRDKPGKSPMGMDLVPVYRQDNKGPDEGVGTINIASNVVNNLGVRTAIAEYKVMNQVINTVGFVTYDEDMLIHIHPRVAGWVEKLYVNAVGDQVKKAQALYDIYSPELVNAQEELLLALDRKNTRLIQAAENRLIALQLSADAIAKLKKTRKVEQTITFYARQNGVVKSLAIREGFYVKPETMMLSIADLSQVWVKAEVFERQAGQVSMGDKVTMTLDYLPSKNWQGRVEHIHPMINSQTRTTVVRLGFENALGELKPNMFAQVSINTENDELALLIPKEALIRTGSQDRVVLALGEGNFKSIAVSVGRFEKNNVEILSGLSEGDRVVSSALFLLDSESSKTSDFQRMTANEFVNSESSEIAKIDSAMVHGTVNSLMAAHRMVNISREAIEKWGRPADDVDFLIAENVDMSLFSIGAYLMFTFEIRDSDFVIVSAMAMPESMNNSSSTKSSEQQGVN